jgi:hypothetical protein
MGLERSGFPDASKATKRTAVRVIAGGILLITILLAVTTGKAYLMTNQQTGTADAVTEWLGNTSFPTAGSTIRPSDVDLTIRGGSEVPPLTNLYTKLNILHGHQTKITLQVIPHKTQSYSSSLNRLARRGKSGNVVN